ncbi:hypothetical protein Aduo_014516 [Ancylostoma duodenale]
MALDTRRKVGCAVVQCSDKTHVVCHYPKIIKKEGEPIYKIGKGPCKDCSKYGKEQVNFSLVQGTTRGLIKVQSSDEALRCGGLFAYLDRLRKEIYFIQVLFAILGYVHAYGDIIKCSETEDEMSRMLRTSFLDMHNSYRSGLARERNASRMRKLVRYISLIRLFQEYDCYAEDSARKSAEKCSDTASPSDKYDENLHVIEEDEEYYNPVLEAGNSWWSEILDTEKNLYNSTVNANFANMAFDKRSKLGCAIVKCSRKHHVVCHYPKM